MGKYRNFGFQIPLDPHVGSGDFDENRVGVGHPTWVDPPVDVSLSWIMIFVAILIFLFMLKVQAID